MSGICDGGIADLEVGVGGVAPGAGVTAPGGGGTLTGMEELWDPGRKAGSEFLIYPFGLSPGFGASAKYL